MGSQEELRIGEEEIKLKRDFAVSRGEATETGNDVRK